jgi:hypothetical protein
VGPFWLEEGLSAVVAGTVIIALFAVLFVIAVIFRPT